MTSLTDKADIPADEAEEVSKCAGCLKPIYEGDTCCITDDGVYLCEEHAFTLSEVVEQHDEILSSVPWEPGELDYDSRDEMREDYLRFKADLESNGDRKLLTVA